MANLTLTGLPRDKNYIPVETYNNVASNRKTVTTHGTAVALLSSQTEAKRVDVSALTTNTNLVYVGNSSVLATAGSEKGVPLFAGNTYTFYVTDVSLIYVDSLVDGEGVAFNYFW